MTAPCYLGLDLGTSGCRAAAIDEHDSVIATRRRDWPAHPADPLTSPEQWWRTACEVLADIAAAATDWSPRALAVDGTSGTVLLCDDHLRARTPALPYHDASAASEAARIAELAPRESGAHGSSSGLAKALRLRACADASTAFHVLNQADWVGNQLCGKGPVSDENNALKLGYDPVARRWPEWLSQLRLPAGFLPRVVPPATPLGSLRHDLSRELGLPADLWIVAGTTDSIAAFLAAGDIEPGTAVTALGTTLVLKVVADTPTFAPEYGVYSHRLDDRWLAGGASNTGGGALAQHFTAAELERLTPALDPAHDTGLEYYPLARPGERFPTPDPAKAPRLAPRPSEPHRFLQGLLEGIARIEASGYRRLAELGASYPHRVITTGGGARNPAWRVIRERYLGVPVTAAAQEEAAVGVATLARRARHAH